MTSYLWGEERVISAVSGDSHRTARHCADGGDGFIRTGVHRCTAALGDKTAAQMASLTSAMFREAASRTFFWAIVI